MLAREYGYQVSRDCALAAAGTNAAAEATGEFDRAAIRTMLWRNGAAFALVALSLLAAYFISEWFASLTVLAILLWCAVFVIDASRRRPSISKLIVFPLGTEPWQAWPCRVEDVRGKANSTTKLVYLMSPDQQVARAFRTPIPEPVRKRMPHGMGVLWICGDLESPPLPGASGVAMGTVKGDIVWGARHASRRQAANGPVPTPAFDRHIDEAASKQMKALLDPRH